ncbi:MAG: LpqB family beta-propeller domain-containing protein, partial [Chloroflexota bacterium]|nr:LpqB family beta-propeller domain-containing protein [Chloroflexota bacterium]
APYDDGETIITVEEPRASIGDFSLSPNNRKIAYIVVDGPIEALWVVDVTGQNQRQLYELSKGGTLTKPSWSPNGQSIVIGHRPKGTHNSSSYDLTLIDLNSSQIIDLDVGQAGESLVWSPNGQWLYYTRPILIELPFTYRTTLHRLEVKR